MSKFDFFDFIVYYSWVFSEIFEFLNFLGKYLMGLLLGSGD